MPINCLLLYLALGTPMVSIEPVCIYCGQSPSSTNDDGDDDSGGGRFVVMVVELKSDVESG